MYCSQLACQHLPSLQTPVCTSRQADPTAVCNIVLRLQGVMEDAAFASFKLQPNFTAPSAQGGRNLSIYVYADSDIVSDRILLSQSWEPSLIQGVVDQLYQFAKVWAGREKGDPSRGSWGYWGCSVAAETQGTTA